MKITRKVVAKHLIDYLNQRTSLLDGEIDPADFEIVRDIVARIGVADVKAFGLTWEDMAGDLARLGYIVRAKALAHA